MPLSLEQIKERTNYIGGTDCAAVLGLSRWRSPIEIWAEKTGLLESEDKGDNLAIEVGTELEDLVCRLFCKRTGKKVRRENQTIFHPRYPFIAANIDRSVMGEDAILEAKTAGAWKAREWMGEEIPQEYILQVLHQLAVTGKEIGYIACLIGGNQEFVWKEIPRDQEIISQIITKEIAFWKGFVEPKIMPAATKLDSGILSKLFPGQIDDDDPIALDDDAMKIIESLEAMEADISTLEGVIEKEKNSLKTMLKDKNIGLVGQYKISWKRQISRRLDTKTLRQEKPEIFDAYTKPSESRVFRILKNTQKEGLKS